MAAGWQAYLLLHTQKLSPNLVASDNHEHLLCHSHSVGQESGNDLTGRSGSVSL